jgi:hypothetical protein
MSTVLRYRNLRLAIYSNDHPPPHVHVLGPDGEARIAIGDDHTPPEIWDFHGMPVRQVIIALRQVARHQTELLAAWRKIHGPLDLD